MPRSMTHQTFLLQKEAVPGTLITAAMRRYMGLKMMVGYNDEGEDFTASSFRVVTSHTATNEWGTHDIEAPQCFNALLPVAASNYGVPVTTQPSVGTAPNAYQHVMTLLGRGEASPVTFSAQWGDSLVAFEMTNLAFQGFGLGVQRGQLSFSTAAISREPSADATLVTAGVTEIPAVPIPARSYDVWVDDTWAALGTTKYLAVYEANSTVGDRWVPDSPINSAVAGFATLLEGEEVEFGGDLRLGLDAVAKALIATYKNGATKYVRIAANGPIIGGAVRYRLQLDMAIIVTARGKVGAAPDSPTVTLPFTYLTTSDTVTGKAAELTLINTVPTL